MLGFRYLSFRRLKNAFFMFLANSLPIQGQQRSLFVKWGGVNVKGHCMIYSHCVFDSVHPELITIGKGVRITDGCKILTHFLDPEKPGVRFKIGPVVIEDDVFLGMNCLICNSVTIGQGAIVGAGSVVTKDIPAWEVWAGNPAHFIKKRAH